MVPVEKKQTSALTYLLWVCVAIAGAVLIGLVWNAVGDYQRDQTQTWTYVVDDTGVVMFESESRGYPKEAENGWATSFMAKQPDGSYKQVQTEFSTMVFGFQVQVVQDPVNNVMKFAPMGSVAGVPPTPTPTPSP